MKETAILAGGCFWCTEAVFLQLKGVESVVPGYTGGTVDNPTYNQVSSGKTGHAEAIKIEFDPSIISFEQILDVFFATHNPLTLNRQGADVGTQYRSSIFPTTNEQKMIAEQVIREKDNSGEYDSPIVTAIEAFKEFYEAEDYHKNYYESHPENLYCSVVISPKLKKFYEKFPDLRK